MIDPEQNRSKIKLIFTPWGASDFGEDVWAMENALVFCLESALEMLEPDGIGEYADLYSQLGGEKVRTSPLPPYTEDQLRQLAVKAPAGTTAIVDGLIDVTRDPETDELVTVQFAPRIYLPAHDAFELPESFVYSGFTPHGHGRSICNVSDPASFFGMAAVMFEALVAPLGIVTEHAIDVERLMVTHSWDAFMQFIKAKRLAKTNAEKQSLYRQALRSDPEFYWAQFNLGQILKGERDFAGARRSFMDSIKAAQGDPKLLGASYFEGGLCSAALGDLITARNFWENALAYSPDNPALLINLAGTFEQEGDFQQAIKLDKQVLEMEPENHKALVSLGRLEATLGNMDQAIYYYELALDLQPEDALRHAIVGGCYVASGDRTKAREHLSLSSQLDPPRASMASVTGSDPLDDTPAPGEYARQELAKLDEFDRVKRR